VKITEKLDLIDRVSRELQSRYTYDDINVFLAQFNIAPPTNITANSKWVYSKSALSSVDSELLQNIAAELELVVNGTTFSDQKPPRNWLDTKLFRLFISHISKDKLNAKRLKECLAPYGIAGFVAHQDIHPTLEWQGEIESALRTMDAFIAVHTEGFSKSVWTQQEIGFALGRGTKVISFKMGEDPSGFISKHQALARQNRTAEAVAQEIDGLLAQDNRTKEKLAEAKASLLPASTSVLGIDEEVPF
jgi:hypothetical protein